MKLTAAQTAALKTLAARGGILVCDLKTLGGYARAATHCRLLGLGLVRVATLRQYAVNRRRGGSSDGYWQTVHCTDITVSLTPTGRAYAV